jgi:hypothetical protein
MKLLLLAAALSIWTGQSGGFEFKWTTQDITVSLSDAPSKTLYSAQRLFQKEQHAIPKDMSESEFRVWKSELIEDDQILRILSVVGPVMSVESYEYCDYKGTAHPTLYSRYTAIDFRHPNRSAQLSDYFPPEEIRKALLQDALVKKQLGHNKPAATLGQLVRQLSNLNIERNICEYGFDADLLSRFAFYQIQEDKVAVRLGLSYGGEPCRGQLTQIGLWLPIPNDLRAAIENARDRREGFLMESRGIKDSLNASDPETIRHQATFLVNKGPAHRD